jgi:plastocyanin
VVHRQLTRPGWSLTALCAAIVSVSLALASTAGAANRRVAIGNYQWSLPQVHLDLGEHVTWYWVGPDTIHSVTGVSANDRSVDSDKGANTPHHALGDTFKVTFDHPGLYEFQCKLHPGVRGTVSVSSTPGNPSREIDPVPEINFDVTPPHLSEVKLRSRKFARSGTKLHLGIDEKSKVDAEYYAMRHGHRAGFTGWHAWRVHVGWNDLRFAGRSKHFRAKPGRYVAVIRATDTSNNTAKKLTRRFRIR